MPRKESYIKRQTRKLSSGKIDRRRFVMSAIASGVTMPTAMSLAAKAQAQVPRSGGHFRYGVGFALGGPDATRARFATLINSTLGSCLTEIAIDGSVEGALAKTFEASNGARTWTFGLRDGVTFHNGQPLTAKDVVTTIASHPLLGAEGPLHQVDQILADGPMRITIHLNTPDPQFDRRMADPRLVIYPDPGNDTDRQPGIGTGAYRLIHHDAGKRAILERNPDHWRRDRGFFDTVELLSMPDTAMRQSAVMNGEVDFIDKVDPRSVALLGRVPTLRILESEGGGRYGFPIPTQIAPFDNPGLSKALSLAIDQRELVEKILLGHGSVACAGAAHDHGGRGTSFDPAAARRAYLASGHQGRIALAASDTVFPGAVAAARLIAASAQKAGIQIDVIDTEDQGGWRMRASDNVTSLVEQSAIDVEGLQIKTNDIHAHSAALAHKPVVGANLRTDVGKIAERWWFA
ncbi:MAG: peptide ABC transporter substrate-binding protein [Silicimonas sp.]|nr:peptide ABC transporter substrate-binding protein [Silicimonas sp.]